MIADLLGGVFRFFLEVVWEILLYGFFYLTGSVLVFAFSFGKVGAESRSSGRRENSSRKEIDPDLTCAIGAIFWVLCLVAWWVFA